MKTVVLKFGGTSVGSIDRIKKVCKIIAAYKKKKNRVLVISSAMSGVTNELVKKSRQISNNFSRSEYDALVSTGEQVSCALIAGRLIHDGKKLKSQSGQWLNIQQLIFRTNIIMPDRNLWPKSRNLSMRWTQSF